MYANWKIFLSRIEKYGPRNRGLTKKDQITISKIDSIDNSWIMQPYGNAEASGMIVNTRETQKMIPYHPKMISLSPEKKNISLSLKISFLSPKK